mmetsp:Transcript_38444/g.98311  ORF Transcript_38444/g.98311 Transcript_38444/m.98311 type:complete len:230 (+) Transcript_38444:221-910(+)
MVTRLICPTVMKCAPTTCSLAEKCTFWTTTLRVSTSSLAAVGDIIRRSCTISFWADTSLTISSCALRRRRFMASTLSGSSSASPCGYARMPAPTSAAGRRRESTPPWPPPGFILSKTDARRCPAPPSAAGARRSKTLPGGAAARRSNTPPPPLAPAARASSRTAPSRSPPSSRRCQPCCQRQSGLRERERRPPRLSPTYSTRRSWRPARQSGLLLLPGGDSYLLLPPRP